MPLEHVNSLAAVERGALCRCNEVLRYCVVSRRLRLDTYKHTFKLVVSFPVINLLTVLLCRLNYLFLITKAALAAVVPAFAW